MNASTNGRRNSRRTTRTFHLAPTTRAIRAALAISFTMLALGGSAAALAGTCVTDPVLNTVTCNGDFNSLPGGEFVPVVDMSLILGDSAPSSVTPGAGVIGIDANWGGNVGVVTHADITTSGADGIHAYGSATATVKNYGAISTDVTAYGAQAMDISAYGDVTVVNGGNIAATGTGVYDATTVVASSLYGNATVANQAAGAITATAQDGNAVAIDVSAYGTAYTQNLGAITASSVNGIAIGVLDQSATGRALFRTFGTIAVSSTNGQAVGALVSGDYVYANNYAFVAYGYPASISVSSGADAAIGIEAYGEHGANVLNTHGSITVSANGGAATGIIADAYMGAARITNSGSISATALDYSPAVGVEAYSAFSGAATVNNSGSIVATALSGNATGVIAQAHYGQVGVVNSGDISASAGVGTYYQHNKAIGILASSGAGYAVGITHVTNSGNIVANGPTLGEGIVGSARYGDLTITSSGTITATGQDEAIGIGTGHDAHNGFGRYIDNYTSQAIIDNAGSITVAADATDCATCKQIEATGIQVFLNYGNDITVSNSGDLAVSVLGGTGTHYSNALGIDAVTYKGDITISNSANLNVTARDIGLLADYNVGILSNTRFGTTSIVNSGNISIDVDGNTSYKNFGIWASTSSNSPTDNGAISVVNSGAIHISANSTDPSHFAVVTEGIYALSNTRNGHGTLSVVNSGDINLSASGGSEMYGIHAYAFGYGDVMVDNSGSITTKNNTFTAYSYNGTAFPGSGGISMGILAKFSSAGATATVTNSGDISATGASNVMGIYARYIERTNYFSTGNLTIDNSGSISATADTFGGTDSAYVAASGIRSRNDDGTTTITNSGSITATVSEDPAGGAYAGATVQGMRISDRSPGGTPPEQAHLAPGYGTISITNSGSITASITSNGLRYANADTADGVVVLHGYGIVDVVNSGAISASAQDDAATAVGTTSLIARGVSVAKNDGASSAVYSQGSETVTNSGAGSISASSTSNYADLSTVATGIYTVLGLSSTSVVSDDRANTIDNAGWVSATATVGGADTLGTATAKGISAFSWSDGLVDVTNSGTVLATATSLAEANATGLYASASHLVVGLDAGGYVGAIASGATGTATGLSLVYTGAAAFAATNAGTINATFNGAGGKAYGANITSTGDLTFTNTGEIGATNAGDAVAVQLNGTTSTTLVNSGLITAVSSASDSIAVRTGDSTDTIQNSGVLNGAVVTAGGDDTLTNSADGVWNVLGTSTDFGSGDDTISNAGTIHLNNSGISLGTDPLGNVFTNSGLITSFGSNRIDMGAGNPNPFTNTGSVDMRNGATGDSLTVAGDWAGSGSIGLDVSGLHNTADQLHIAGNVASGSVTAVDLNLLDLPTTATSSVKVVDVTGDSAAGSFVLGDVHFDTNKSFLVVQGVDLTSNIDASNAHPDTFSVGVAVTGLTDSGSLAAAFVPGVQSLMNSEVGTWHQRMGVIDKTSKGQVSAWARAFSDSGTVNPDHIANNFGQGGNPAFDQDNSGQELGVDFGVTDSLSVGLLLGKAQGSQHLANGGTGRNKITGDTRGAYATWLTSKGFYLDASYRWMDFDARLDTVVGDTRTKGKAGTFNLEAGQDITLGDGFKVTPELQYTKTSVDQLDTLSGALAGFTPKGGDSSRGRAGVRLSKDIGSGTVWTPYAAVSGVREFDGDSTFDINGTFNGATSTKGTSALVEGGLAMRTGKLSIFGGVNWQDGGALSSVVGGQLGVRYSW